MGKACWSLVALLAIQVNARHRCKKGGDGCTVCINQEAGNCYHASWPGKSYDKCSKETSKDNCENNENGVWCTAPPPSPGPGPGPSPGPSPGGQEITLKMVTFYGYPDNCPPSAQPHSLGTGTYNNPITFAAAPSAIKHGSIMYVKHFKKYFIMDDECEECEEDWKRKGVYHTDMWLGPDHMKQSYTRLVGCEDALSGEADGSTAILHPPSNLTADTTPFYDAANDTCMKPADPCHETCNPQVECNECDGLSGSCEEVASKFSLSVECFKKLNPKIDCDKGLSGQTFCQGSGCPLKNVLPFLQV